jgi:drug/metabolite transporter (DMT)-like permease
VDTVNPSSLRADLLLLLTAVIWGSAFVAQRVGMESMGPMLFTGLRFALGALVIVPLVLAQRRKVPTDRLDGKRLAWGGALAGLVLFGGSALQQIGLVHTTAGKAGFITGLYVVIVPLLGLLVAHRPGPGTWLGAVLAMAGLYLLSVTRDLTMAWGDLVVLAGAFFWATHVLLLAWLVSRSDAVSLALIQFVVCAGLSLVAAWLTEPISVDSVLDGLIPILYGGVLSVGVGYTLQAVAQREAVPAHAAIILSLEAVFAALAGWMILDERLGARELAGCGLMLGGMLVSQIAPLRGRLQISRP